MAVAATASANAVPLAAVSSPSCPAFTFVGARGSGETDKNFDGMGPEVMTAFKEMQGKLGATVIRSVPVKYTAADVDVLRKLYPAEQLLLGLAVLGPLPARPSATVAFTASYKINHLDRFTASINEGITNAVATITSEAGRCGRTRFVLAGYSQGAMVMHQVLLRLEGNRVLYPRIAATVLIADGDRKKETAATRFGTAEFTAEGIRSAFTVGEKDVPSSKASSTYDICNAGDIVCDFHLAMLRDSKPGENVHTGYTNSRLVKNVAIRVAGTL
ncbi:cutinase family protein [Dactylosporangium sp. McL0621]|uniref:cutinase family protein n=1 Tax=Dactylosporangium sp. McL0621 TaxID=3415678 RepID=UPI003CE8FB42